MNGDYLGVTPPVSISLPTDAEIRLTGSLLEELRRQNTFETPADTEKRRKVLASLQKIADEFVKSVARAQTKKNDLLIKNARGRIFTFGSFHLGVFGPGSDIDTLVVAPKYVSRDDYFNLFPDLLVQMAPKGAITNLSSVPTSWVPIIRFEYFSISIDLIFASIKVLEEIPVSATFDLHDDNLLRGLDRQAIMSLNGTRVTDQILDLVPEHSTFRQCLRAIKLWAQRRAIYGNMLGFPGGVAWAIMVARVCQLFPKATSSLLIHKFFSVMNKWPWPDAVVLKPIEPGHLGLQVWDRKQNSHQLMPIITPAYPSICATYNVTHSANAIIKKEINRAFHSTAMIMDGKRSWSSLFDRHTFFTQDYKYYIAVTAAATTKDAHGVFAGHVGSRVRVLVGKLESHAAISIACPFVKAFERTRYCKEDHVQEVLDGSLTHVVNRDARINDSKQDPANATCSDEELSAVYTSTYYIGLELSQGSKSLDLSHTVDDFRHEIFKREELQTAVNGLQITYVRSYDLPDDLFGPGDVKPPRKPSINSTNVPKKKRRSSISEDAQRPTKKQHTSVAAAG